MILSQEDIVERYPNGNIAYIETRAVIAPLWIAQYPNHRITPDGKLWIRIGVNKKYSPDGKLRWEILYDNCGNMINR